MSSNLQCFTFRTVKDTTARSKQGKKTKINKRREAREAKYLESAARIEDEMDVKSLANSYAIEANPTMKQKPHTAVSMESLFSVATRGRARTASRLSAIHTEDFWLRHFDGNNLISWKQFRAAFLGDYGSMIHDFAPKRMHWILYIVHTDIFGAADDIHKLYYDKFCGKSEDPDRLWVKIKEYATERIFREGVIESMFE